jgi:putative transposase
MREKCELLEVNRSMLYYEPAGPSEETLDLLAAIDKLFTSAPFLGARRLRELLERQGYRVSRQRVRRLMKLLGLEAIYPGPKTSIPSVEHKKYPYLLRGLDIDHPNQVWASDITYIPMRKGFVYVVAVIDWYSRFVLSWSLSNTLDSDFCVQALNEALKIGSPEIFNTDQGSQFTDKDFVGCLLDHNIKVSMDGRRRWVDNVMVERLWRSLKYEEVYTHAYETIAEARSSIAAWFGFYNYQRPHQSLEYLTPCEAHNKGLLAQADRIGAGAPILIMPSPGTPLNDGLALSMVSSHFTGALSRYPRR